MARKKLEAHDLFHWEGAFENYAKKFVRANHWRVAHIFGGPDDALQQAAMIFAKCRLKRAAEGVYEQRHMMALYKQMLVWHFDKAAKGDGRFRGANDPATLAQMPEWQDGAAHNDGPLACLLGQASEEARYVLRSIMEAPAEVLAILLPGDEGCDLELLDRRFRRWFGLPAGAKVASEIKKLLSE